MTADFIELHSGQAFRPLDPDIEQINIEDIAHALSQLCRFNGHSHSFYSVAQHSVHVSRLLQEWGHGPSTILWGLLHDGSEAYLVDVPTPLKRSEQFSAYRKAEEKLQALICERYGLPHKMPDAVKKADEVLLSNERKCLMPNVASNWVGLTEEPLLEDIIPWAPEVAKNRFLARFYEFHGRAA